MHLQAIAAVSSCFGAVDIIVIQNADPKWHHGEARFVVVVVSMSLLLYLEHSSSIIGVSPVQHQIRSDLLGHDCWVGFAVLGNVEDVCWISSCGERLDKEESIETSRKFGRAFCLEISDDAVMSGDDEDAPGCFFLSLFWL